MKTNRQGTARGAKLRFVVVFDVVAPLAPTCFLPPSTLRVAQRREYESISVLYNMYGKRSI